MFLKKASGPRTVDLPDGSVLSLADLPAGDTRWVASRKATVVRAVVHHLLTREAALKRWQLTEEELDGWINAHAQHGTQALKVTALQRYRQPADD